MTHGLRRSQRTQPCGRFIFTTSPADVPRRKLRRQDPTLTDLLLPLNSAGPLLLVLRRGLPSPLICLQPWWGVLLGRWLASRAARARSGLERIPDC